MSTIEKKDITDASGDSDKTGKAKSLVQDPLALAALQAEHHHEAHTFMLTLPPIVRRRVNALKNLQVKAVRIEAEFYKEVHDLEIKYAKKHAELNHKAELKEKLSVSNGPQGGKDEKGSPDFWLTLLKNTDIIGEMIQEHDEPILKYLTNIDVTISSDPMSFTLHFYFSPNEYFTYTVLTKEYMMKCEPEPDHVFEFDGPEIVSCKAKVDWKTDKNVTVKNIKKKQKHKLKGATRFVTKEVKTDSFFNFFEPPAETEEMDEENQQLLNADFEIGQIIRDRIVPHAVLYYTGEAHDEDDEEYDDEDEEDEEGLSDEMDDEEDDE